MLPTIESDSLASLEVPTGITSANQQRRMNGVMNSRFANPSGLRSQYLLMCQARTESLSEGWWQFALETSEGELVLEAEDLDSGDLNRLTLLATLRGLEAIDGPSSVTLFSTSRYLIRSLSDSLPRWRRNQFAWEHFGRRIDVQHADLWRRIDRALNIHHVEACLISSRVVSVGSPDLTEANGSRSNAASNPAGSGSTKFDSTPSTNRMMVIDSGEEASGSVRLDLGHDNGSEGPSPGPPVRRRRGHRPSQLENPGFSESAGSGQLSAARTSALGSDRLRKWLLTPAS